MKRLRMQFHRLSLTEIGVILLIFGLFFGVLFANVFRDSYSSQMKDYQNTIFADVSENTIDYSGLFRYTLLNNLNEYVIFWLLCITVLGIPYMAFKIVSFGFFSGFLISAVTMQYGLKGIVLILAYQFPHGLVYLPVALLCLYKGFRLNRTIYNDSRNPLGGIPKLIKENIIIIIILAAMLLIGSLLEAYVGSFLLKKAMGLFT